MRFSQRTIGLDPTKASDTEIRQAIIKLRNAYVRTEKAFNKLQLDEEPVLLKEAKNRLSIEPELKTKPVYEMDYNELQKSYSIYRNYFTSPVYDDNGLKVGYKENITASVSGWEKVQKNIADNILGQSEYNRLSEKQKSDVWEIISKVKKLLPEYYASGVYSGQEATQIMAEYIFDNYDVRHLDSKNFDVGQVREYVQRNLMSTRITPPKFI